MTDWGAVSSWVAAGISVTAFGAGSVRAWWNRPQVDWALTASLEWPNYDRPGFNWMEGEATFSNFGDGPAHRVAVHIHRGDADLSQLLATSPLIKPGDAIQFFNAGCLAGDFTDTYLWVTWTPPPIRRRRQRTSSRVLLAEHAELSDIAKRKFDEFLTEQQRQNTD